MSTRAMTTELEPAKPEPTPLRCRQSGTALCASRTSLSSCMTVSMGMGFREMAERKAGLNEVISLHFMENCRILVGSVSGRGGGRYVLCSLKSQSGRFKNGFVS